MPVLSRGHAWIHAQCTSCARTFSASTRKDVCSFFLNRKNFKRDLCAICRSAQQVGYYEYQCAGCHAYVQGTRDELVDCRNVSNQALCQACTQGYYGTYDQTNEALVIAMNAITDRSWRTEPRRYPHYLEFREEEAAYTTAVRNLTRRNYRCHTALINPKGRLVAATGTPGGHHIDHVVPLSLCFRYNVPIAPAAAPANLQVIPWRINLMRGNSAFFHLVARNRG
jgi:hypothetical protein